MGRSNCTIWVPDNPNKVLCKLHKQTCFIGRYLLDTQPQVESTYFLEPIQEESRLHMSSKVRSLWLLHPLCTSCTIHRKEHKLLSWKVHYKWNLNCRHFGKSPLHSHPPVRTMVDIFLGGTRDKRLGFWYHKFHKEMSRQKVGWDHLWSYQFRIRTVNYRTQSFLNLCQFPHY